MKISHVALALSLALSSISTAWAQNVPAAPAQGAMNRTPPVAAQTSGNLARFVVGPGGHVRGLALDNGALVMLSPRSTQDIASRVRVGQPLRIEGVTRAGAGTTVLHRATVRAADGTVLVAPPARPSDAQPGMRRGRDGAHHGPRMHARRGARRAERRAERLASLPPQQVSGAVQQVVTGPRGGVRALLLANNATVMVPRAMGQQLGQRGVRAGETVRVAGRGNTTPQGTGVVAERLTLADGTTLSAQPAAPRKN